MFHLFQVLETLVIGPYSNFWCLYDRKTLLHVSGLLILIIVFYFLYFSLLVNLNVSNWFLNNEKAHFGYRFLSFVSYTVAHIPFVGKKIAKAIKNKFSYINKNVLPFYENLKLFMCALFWKTLGDLVLENNKNMVVVITGDELDINDKTFSQLYTNPDKTHNNTLILSNHRSLFDYVLINYLIQQAKNLDSMKQLYFQTFCKNNYFINETVFVNWKTIIGIPNLKTIFSVIFNHENDSITENALMDYYLKNNSVSNFDKKKTFNYVLFPEVSVITNQGKTIQDKINAQNGIHVFKNLLYPRFRNFITMLDFFKELSHLKNDSQEDSKCRETPDTSKPQNTMQTLKSTQLLSIFDNVLGSNLNDHLYDFTITYYQPVHVHNDSYSNAVHLHTCHEQNHKSERYSMKTFQEYIGTHSHKTCTYELLHLTPSLLEMFLSRFNNTMMPIIIRVHIQKKNLHTLLRLDEKHLEKWLEDDWFEKDKIIENFDRHIKLVSELK